MCQKEGINVTVYDGRYKQYFRTRARGVEGRLLISVMIFELSILIVELMLSEGIQIGCKPSSDILPVVLFDRHSSQGFFVLVTD